ncbi:MAG: VIT1/CCC1 transporter family protein [Candidatus Vogelbacteria bacterium]|nr:VIT1/CCC1 transporter family protein [Candidatus Vogelbacteria bacterium]
MEVGSTHHIKDIVYGANDGIITTFAVVASVAGASLSVPIVLVIGLASLFADGFSMAASNYLGTKSEHDALCADAGMPCTHSKSHRPLLAGAITFVAFVSAGLVPLLPFALLPTAVNIFPYAVLSTACALFLVGASRSIITGKSALSSGAEMLAVGGIAAAIAYYVGAIVRDIVG